ncbi:MAG: HAMP domain-containing histidine kinase [Bacteroidales bacterium]|nr:HAMP domain-containing histidine kinase [Bacteroidales bacterium]
MKNILAAISGSKEHYNIMHRTLNIVLAVAVLMSFISFILISFLKIPDKIRFLPIIAASFFTIAYFISYKSKSFVKVVTFLAFSTILFLIPLSWISNEGSSGGTHYFIFLICIAIYTLASKKNRVWYIGLLLLVVFGLFYFEVKFPNYIYYYPDLSSKYFIFSIYVTFSMIISVFFLDIYYKYYLTVNRELKYKNKELKMAKEQIYEQKEKIELQYQQLKEKADELKIANETKDKFYSIIAHDLKSPFNTIINFTQLIQEYAQKGDYESFKQYLCFLSDSSEQVYSLLLNLLEWSKIQSKGINYYPEKVDVQICLSSVLKIFQYTALSKNISIINQLHDCLVFADKNMLETIFRNLVSNSIKFTKDAKIYISNEKKNTYCVIRIKDEGIGMDEKELENIFDPKNVKRGTNGEKGSGLGLSLVKEFIKINKGELFIESKKGKGSSFSFTLPLYTEKSFNKS